MGSNRKFVKTPDRAWFSRHSETVMPEGQEAGGTAGVPGQHRKAASSLGCSQEASEGADGSGTPPARFHSRPFSGHSVPPAVTDKPPCHLMPAAPSPEATTCTGVRWPSAKFHLAPSVPVLIPTHSCHLSTPLFHGCGLSSASSPGQSNPQAHRPPPQQTQQTSSWRGWVVCSKANTAHHSPLGFLPPQQLPAWL